MNNSVKMLELYSWGTPNGHKVHIMLEESNAEFNIIPVDINNQNSIEINISQINANKKIPVLVDDYGSDGNKRVVISESGAILLYLADKYQKFLSQAIEERYQSLQWLMFQMSAVGPMMGQCNHFKGRINLNDAYPLERFETEVKRQHSVMNSHLSNHKYFGGSQYTIADMAIFPWLRLSEKLGIAWGEYPHLHKWFEEIIERPAVQRALKLPDITVATKV